MEEMSRNDVLRLETSFGIFFIITQEWKTLFVACSAIQFFISRFPSREIGTKMEEMSRNVILRLETSFGIFFSSRESEETFFIACFIFEFLVSKSFS